MKINLGQFIRKSAEDVSLAPHEREHILRVIQEYAAMKPIRWTNVKKQGAALSSMYSFARRVVALGLVVALISSGTGISYAAETAVPGDILYPVKVNVNEEVRARFAISAEAKAEWDVRRAERRLEEAAELAYKGKLTPGYQAMLKTSFEEHAERVAEDVEALNVGDAAAAINVASSFETKLGAHGELLAELNSNNGSLIASVRDKARAVRSVRVRSEGRFKTTASASARAFAMSAETDAAVEAGLADDDSPEEESVPENFAVRMGESAKRQLKSAMSLFERAEANLNEGTRTRISAELEVAEALIQEGDRLTLSGEFGEAFHAYQDAQSKCAKLAVYLKASKRLKFDIDIRPLPRPVFDDNSEDDRGRPFDSEESISNPAREESLNDTGDSKENRGRPSDEEASEKQSSEDSDSDENRGSRDSGPRKDILEVSDRLKIRLGL